MGISCMSIANGIALAILFSITTLSSCNTDVRMFCQNLNSFSKIGSGSYGVVYSARERFSYIPEPANYPIFAVKEFSIRNNNDDAKVEINVLSQIGQAFDVTPVNSEEDRLRRFSHYYGACQNPHGAIMIVTDYIPFGLETIIPESRTISQDTSVIYGIVRAVHQIHSFGFVHLDLKPNNIRIGVNGVVKLIDFGLSEYILPLVPYKQSRVTSTLIYMPPEVLLREMILDSDKFKIDIWSIGIIAYNVIMRKDFLDNMEVREVESCIDRLYDKIHHTEQNWLGLSNAIYLLTMNSFPNKDTTDYNSVVIDDVASQCFRTYVSGTRHIREELSSTLSFSRVGSLGDENSTENDAFVLEKLLFDKFLVLDQEKRATSEAALEAMQHGCRGKGGDLVVDYNTV